MLTNKQAVAMVLVAVFLGGGVAIIYDNPFAEEVRENPYDDTPRLIFADYLDDSGDPLGQLIRVQVELANMRPDDGRRTQLEKQEQAIIAEYGEGWLEPLRQFGAEGISARCFQRGLVERLRISAENFLQHSEALCLQSPALHTLALTGLDRAFSKFMNAQLPAQIRGLDLSLNRLNPLETADRHWAMLNCIEQLTWLDVRNSKASDFGIAQLCTRDLSNLRHLDVSLCGLSAASASALANCPTLVNLRTLKMSLNEVGDAGLASIAASPNLAGLEQLDVASNSIEDQGAEALTRSTTLTSLQRINLRANSIMSQKFAIATSYVHLTKLKEIDVRNNPIRQS